MFSKQVFLRLKKDKDFESKTDKQTNMTTVLEKKETNTVGGEIVLMSLPTMHWR